MTEDEAWSDLPVESEFTREQRDADEDGLRAGVSGVAGGCVEELLAVVAGFAAQAIPGVDGVAAVAGVRCPPDGAPPRIQSWTATAEFARQIGTVQYETFREGPCRRRKAQPILVVVQHNCVTPLMHYVADHFQHRFVDAGAPTISSQPSGVRDDDGCSSGHRLLMRPASDMALRVPGADEAAVVYRATPKWTEKQSGNLVSAAQINLCPDTTG